MLESHSLALCLQTVCAHAEGVVGAQTALAGVVSLAASTAEIVDVSVTSVVYGTVVTAATSSPTLYELDHLEGPHTEAFRTANQQAVLDMRAELKWHNFATHCQKLGYSTAVALPLVSSTGVLGTLNLFSPRPEVFLQGVPETIEPFIALSANVLLVERNRSEHSREMTTLKSRMLRREEIDQAKGVLVAKMRCSVERATELLIEQSQRENRKLHDVAHEVVKLAGGVQ
jgi:hypothetical protein